MRQRRLPRPVAHERISASMLAGLATAMLIASASSQAFAVEVNLQALREAGGALLDVAGTRAGEVLRLGIEREPAVMAAIAAAIAVPGLAVLVAVTRGANKLARRRRQHAGRDGAMIPSPGRGQLAWIEMAGERKPRLAIGELLRIGSGEDCELPLCGTGLADTHAVIQRNEDAHFVLFDVSADEATGVSVNGERLASGLLRDGDLIELGASRMVFRQGDRTGPAAPPPATGH